MNALAQATQLSPETTEIVLGSGDLSKLTSAQRVQYYLRTCETVGLNPMTRPFRFMNFQGQTVMYATRDCSDQLRQTRKISVRIADKSLDGDLFIVTARARTPDGREDEDVGAVMLGKLYGDARANAIMKAMTKAKRRVTLSICGLGFLDETEVKTLPGAKMFDAEDEPAPPAAAPPPPATVNEAETAQAIFDTIPALMQDPRGDPPPEPAPPKSPAQGARGPTIRDWLDELEADLGACETQEAIDERIGREDVQKATAAFREGAADRLNSMIRDAFDRVLIAGAQHLEA